VREGCYHSDEVDSWGTTNCAYCGCVIDYQDNSPVYNIYEELYGVRSKRKVLKIITDFNEVATGVKKEMKFTTIPSEELKTLKSDLGGTRYDIAPPIKKRGKKVEKVLKRVVRRRKVETEDEFPF
jgi:hypothetical protein